MKKITRRDSSMTWTPKIPWYVSVQFKDTLRETQFHCNWWITSQFLTHEKSLYYTDVIPSISNSPLTIGSIQEEEKVTRKDKQSSSYLSQVCRKFQVKKIQWRSFITKKSTLLQKLKVLTRYCVLDKNYHEYKIKNYNYDRRNQMSYSCTLLCQKIISTR